jgi:DNA-binding SARP family transcriptional activator
VIDYRLLGPLEVACDGRALDLGGRKQRILLTSLLLHANQPVRRDVLIDHIWGEHPPAGPDHAVDVYIWRLRKRLDPAAGSPCVLTQPGGYVLQVTQEQVDTARFERLAEEARCLLVAGVADRAAEGFARRWPCGGARHSLISAMSRSRRRRSRDWSNSEPRWWRTGLTPISRSDATSP